MSILTGPQPVSPRVLEFRSPISTGIRRAIIGALTFDDGTMPAFVDRLMSMSV